MLEFLISPTWDGVRNWLATVGGLIALSIATNTYRNSVRVRREEQPRLVYTRLEKVEAIHPGEIFTINPDSAAAAAMLAEVEFVRDDPDGYISQGQAEGPIVHTTVSIHNGSKEVIGPMRVRLAYHRNKWPNSPGVTVNTVEPDSTLSVVLIADNTLYPGTPVLRPELLFRDSNGTWWSRSGTDPIKRVHNDPENPTSGLPALSGVTLSRGYGQHGGRRVFVTPRVRWHRLLRKLRGEPSIP